VLCTWIFTPGLVLLLKDLNGIYANLKGIENKGSTYLMRDDIPELEDLEKIAADSGNSGGIQGTPYLIPWMDQGLR
jgi:hypothetical protein